MARPLKIPLELSRREDIGTAAKLCYAALDYYCYRSNQCWPSHSTIANLLGISRATVKVGLNELKEKKFIEEEHRLVGTGEWHSNMYTLLWRPPKPKKGGGSKSTLGRSEFNLGGGLDSSYRSCVNNTEEICEPPAISSPPLRRVK